MRLGLLADIHEDVTRLQRAIAKLGRIGVDQLVVLGDIFDRGPRLDETAAILDEAGIVGVWGNHDAGFCLGEPLEALRDRYDSRTIRLMSRLLPRLELDGCLFTHIEPWLDPNEIEGLWWCDSLPNTPDRVAASFAAVPHRLIVMGHIHRWILARPGQIIVWDASIPFAFDPEARYLVVVHAVADGWAAVLDTTANVLTPVPLDDDQTEIGFADSSRTT